MRKRTKAIDHVERSDEALASRAHILLLYAYYMAAAADISHANFQRRMRARKIGLSVAIKSYLYTVRINIWQPILHADRTRVDLFIYF